jgi:hypothetical protein
LEGFHEDDFTSVLATVMFYSNFKTTRLELLSGNIIAKRVKLNNYPVLEKPGVNKNGRPGRACHFLAVKMPFR